jgi:hypothetical protein
VRYHLCVSYIYKLCETASVAIKALSFFKNIIKIGQKLSVTMQLWPSLLLNK